MNDSRAEGVELAVSGDGGVRLVVRVKPGGRATRLVGAHAGALKVEVTAAPERGKANAAVVTKLLAGFPGRAAQSMSSSSVATRTNKTVVLHGITIHEVSDRLRQAGVRVDVVEKS